MLILKKFRLFLRTTVTAVPRDMFVYALNDQRLCHSSKATSQCKCCPILMQFTGCDQRCSVINWLAVNDRLMTVLCEMRMVMWIFT